MKYTLNQVYNNPELLRTENFSEQFLIDLVIEYPSALKHIQNQTDDICMAAVKEDGMVLQFVEKQTPKICMAAIEQDDRALAYVKNNISPYALNRSFLFK